VPLGITDWETFIKGEKVLYRFKKDLQGSAVKEKLREPSYAKSLFLSLCNNRVVHDEHGGIVFSKSGATLLISGLGGVVPSDDCSPEAGIAESIGRDLEEIGWSIV
jgi:hypothetical protein